MKDLTEIDVGTPLRNSRHEAFARSIARGISATEAYQKVYKCKTTAAGQNGYKLLKNAQIVARIDHLKAITTSKSILSVIEIREYHADLLRCSVANLPTDSPLITRIKRRKVSEEDAGGIIEEIWVADKLKAAETELKLMGALKEGGTEMHINNQTIMVVLPGEIMEPRRVVRRIEQGQDDPNGSSSESAG